MTIRSIASGLHGTIRRFCQSSGGNATLFATLAAIPVIGAAGMAIDYARVSRVHDRMQLVVDGAALAAVSAKSLSGTSTEKAAARVSIAKNYLNNGFATLTDARLLGQPKVTAAGNTVAITAKAEVKGSFMNVFDAVKDSSEVDGGDGGEAVGAPSGRTYGITVSTTASFKSGASSLCMLVLNPSASQSLQIQGTADLYAPGCAVWVNSSSNSGLYENGTATMTAKLICVNGNYAGTAYFPYMPKHGSTDCPVYPDPLKAKFLTDYSSAYSAAYSGNSISCFKGGKCRYDGYNTSSKKFSPLTISGSGTDVTLQPGIYDGGIEVKAGATVRLAAGTYFIQNGLFSTRQATVMNADAGGVTIIMTEPTAGTKVTTSTQTRIDIQAQTNLALKAPTSGAFAGIVIAQHPNSITSTSKTTANTVIGGGIMNITGMIYYPTNILYITGSGTGTDTNPEKIATDDPLFAIVADKVFIEGNGQLRIGGAADNEAAGLPALPTVGAGIDTVALK